MAVCLSACSADTTGPSAPEDRLPTEPGVTPVVEIVGADETAIVVPASPEMQIVAVESPATPEAIKESVAEGVIASDPTAVPTPVVDGPVEGEGAVPEPVVAPPAEVEPMTPEPEPTETDPVDVPAEPVPVEEVPVVVAEPEPATVGFGYPSPRVAELGEVRFENDFSGPGKQVPRGWEAIQKTRFEVRNGVLHGRPSANTGGAHSGVQPRLAYEMSQSDVVLGFKFRMVSGKASSKSFFELGHWSIRTTIGKSLTTTTYPAGSVDNKGQRGDVTTLIKNDWSVDMGTWYSVLAESAGDELSIQVRPEGEETIVMGASHPLVGQLKDRIMINGYDGGEIEIDDIMVWDVAGPLGQ